MATDIGTSTLVDAVAHEIRELILTGQIEPGKNLPTRAELAERFGVGVSTVHEAVQALAAVGMVASRPGKGTWVRKDALATMVHPDAVKARLGELDAHTLHETRSVLEVALVGFASDRATPVDAARIDAALEGMRTSMHGEGSFVESDIEFHMAIAQAAHNHLLEQLYRLLRRLLADFSTPLVTETSMREELLRHHVEVAQAIERHDHDGACESISMHLEYVSCLRPHTS